MVAHGDRFSHFRPRPSARAGGECVVVQITGARKSCVRAYTRNGRAPSRGREGKGWPMCAAKQFGQHTARGRGIATRATTLVALQAAVGTHPIPGRRSPSPARAVCRTSCRRRRGAQMGQGNKDSRRDSIRTCRHGHGARTEPSRLAARLAPQRRGTNSAPRVRLRVSGSARSICPSDSVCDEEEREMHASLPQMRRVPVVLV